MAEFIKCYAFCGEYDFLSTCLFLVTRTLTFLLPGYKVNQDGSLFTWSFLWLTTSDLVCVPLPQIASRYPKIVPGTVFTKVLCWCEDKFAIYWHTETFLVLHDRSEFNLIYILSQDLFVLRMEHDFSSVTCPKLLKSQFCGQAGSTYTPENMVVKITLCTGSIKILLQCDWSKCTMWLNIPSLKLGHTWLIFPKFSKIQHVV